MKLGIVGLPNVGKSTLFNAITNAGVAAGLISVPLRYMHTPGEVVDLAVVEQCVKLLVEFTKSVGADETFAW